MKQKTWVSIVIFFTVFSYGAYLQAQNFSKKYTVEWKNPLHFQQDEQNIITLLHFTGAIAAQEFPTLPSFNDKVAINSDYNQFSYTVKNIQTAPFSSEERSLIPSQFVQSELKIDIQSGTLKSKNFALISFIPIIFIANTPYKVTSFDLEISPSSPKMKRDYRGALNSVLTFGDWYKIGIVETGLYKVTYSDLVSLGVATNGLSSANIALFGNGGGVLRDSNSIERSSDLTENSILMVDGGDGIFNEGDYFIFYGSGIHSWNYNSITNQFNHTFNIYAEKTYYFITIDPSIGEKKRIELIDNSGLTENLSVSTFTHYDFYENDKINFGESGTLWFDEGFEVVTNKTYNFTIPESNGTGARLTISAASTSNQSSSFSIVADGVALQNMSLGAISSNDFATGSTRTYSISNITSPLTIDITYNKPSSSAAAYLDYIELEMIGNLKMYANQFPFCNPQTIGVNNITQFQIGNSNSLTKVWDVTTPTNPIQILGTLNGAQFSFKTPTPSLRKFVAFNGNSFYSVSTVGKVKNQNLIGTCDVDFIIISHPDFISEAERLAQFRRTNDGLSVMVVTPEQMYNEFSSGAQDPTAIRDFMRAIYKKTEGSFPKYLLLVGRPSYDYRGKVSGTKLYVPNYQTFYSLNENSLGANDDYFALLDDNEGGNCTGLLDIGVGRFPVTTLQQAKICVDKTIQYSSKINLVPSNSPLVSNFGDWRNVITFVGDDEDSHFHMMTADAGATKMGNNYPHFNIDKIYCDAFQQVSYAGGQRYPDVNKAINDRMERGSLIFTYAGHGGGNGWATERILEISDINKWTNKYNQPLMINLTCSFGWIDRKATSPSELVFVNDKGGAAAMITTSRVAFTGSNYTFCEAMFSTLLVDENETIITIGDFNKAAKNGVGGAKFGINMFVVLGDPSMKLNFPKYYVSTDSINGISVTQTVDTIKALDKVVIKGRVTDKIGNTLTSFNGNVYPSVFDKEIKAVTLMNDPTGTDEPFEFDLQKNILFRGNVSVINGLFEFTFVVPKDINYAYGNGKLSYYARSNNADGTGYYDQIMIGGFSDNPIVDDKGPQIDAYLNDEKFVNGGITNQNPLLFIKLKDENGINTTGNGIGHDLVAILDNNTDNQIILNDFYQASQDSFNSGTVRYPLEGLSVGNHTLKIRAWDIANNVTETTIEFTVVSDEGLTIEHVLNYPNPFTTKTAFFFEHNQPGETFDIMVQIFTISGKLIKTIHATQLLEGTRSDGMEWNGLDEYGDKIGKGTYIYKLSVRNSAGNTVEKFEKIVIL